MYLTTNDFLLSPYIKSPFHKVQRPICKSMAHCNYERAKYANIIKNNIKIKW